MDIILLKTAFRKLLTYTYFDKSDMVLRRNVALFAKTLFNEAQEQAIFGKILEVAIGQNETQLEQWLGQMELIYLPKTLKQEEIIDEESHLITNVPPEKMVAERLLIKVDIPVELLIIDVAWIILYGYKVDSNLYDKSWGNRIDLVAGGNKVREGNALFKKYHTQYRRWWQTGLNKANVNLKKGKNISIINFDLQNYYHSIDFDFDKFLEEYDNFWPNDNIQNDNLTQVVRRIYGAYWQLTQASDEEALCGGNDGKRPLPLSLMSARIFANWYLTPLDDYITKTYKPLYYGRYVDDCMVVVETNSTSKKCIDSIEEELPQLFEWNDSITVSFKFASQEIIAKPSDRLQGLTLQGKKLYIYRFDCELPQASIEKYEEDQIQRSSEFRFQTDEADGNYGGLETVTLINTLDADEEQGRRFDILEENKYKLSVYLAKLCTKLAKFGKEYEHYDEVGKVAHYFHGGLLIKHFVLWERLMSVFVLASQKELVKEFVIRTKTQIHQLEVGDGVFLKDKATGVKRLKECLLFHLEQSRLMALSLHKEGDRIETLYLDTFMVRMRYNIYPMQEFASEFSRYGVRLKAEDLRYSTKKLKYRWLPYFVKLYDVVCMYCIGKPYSPTLYEKAFNHYMKINGIGSRGSLMYAIMRRPKGDTISEFNTDLSMGIDDENKLTVGVVNMEINQSDAEKLIDNYGNKDKDKSLSMMRILDQITNIPSVSIFLLPEVSLPEYELKNYCRYSADKEKAFVAGLEYVVKGNKVFNYTITCLPVVLFGQKDTLPVIRLKNHYAPAEIDKIEEKGLQVPVNKKVYQNLYHWHGHVFATYYCYELTSIQDRSFFFGKLDAVYCPVFNPDTYYFNNIAESLVRDMHCYFLLSNVSHYGDSRVTKPAKHVEMNMMKVKGGNTDDNNEIVMSAELDIAGIRKFQRLAVKDQKGEYKKTPPRYTAKMADERSRNHFLYAPKNDKESFLSGLNLACMEYLPERV